MAGGSNTQGTQACTPLPTLHHHSCNTTFDFTLVAAHIRSCLLQHLTTPLLQQLQHKTFYSFPNSRNSLSSPLQHTTHYTILTCFTTTPLTCILPHSSTVNGSPPLLKHITWYLLHTKLPSFPTLTSTTIPDSRKFSGEHVGNTHPFHINNTVAKHDHHQ